MLNKKKSASCHGLTIIEALLTLAIISILSGIALVYINSDSFRLNSEARNLRSALSQARMLAVKTNQSATVKIWTGKYEDSSGVVVDLQAQGLTLAFSGGGSLPDGGYTLRFSPSGTTPNSHYHLSNQSGETISIRMNSVGRIWLERN
ncbi:GspH/FimT family pseudopilin [Desulfonatronovibrio hydrogenovorans]|uniref:GspH/FimT family pseudopilin n=1 Tax=Desulfonatronovibrio hydrogenovorans TaxID=53245 RepID=UPI000490C0E6|nr:GspH/FimT family pseudopilin [Desulfonatronovibrio hydrogenovorans]